jgi:glycosyltransferase involved in cell wall biosynthesis
MKIVICWSNYTGYWATCWRKLARRPGVELFVIAFRQPTSSPFDECLLEEIPHRLLDDRERTDPALVIRIVAEQAPDVIQMAGWFVPAYRAVAQAPELAQARNFISVDSQFRNWRQLLTRWRYRRFFRHVDGAGTTGERSMQYVRRLGLPMARIRRHMYGVDEDLAAGIYEARKTASPRRAFLFVGRYGPEKGLDVLVDAYRRYRELSSDPWDLVCCGSGADGHLLKGQDGILDMGFVAPKDIHTHFRDASAYVTSSRSDNWPLATVEAAMAGLPVIASDACGTVTELVRPDYNGFITPTGDSAALTQAMLRMQDAPVALWGERAREHALPFTSELWATRWLDFFEEVTGRRAAIDAAAVAQEGAE